MMDFIENIGIALLISGLLSFGLYFIISRLYKVFGIFHFVGLGVLFVLLSYQSYRFLCAWDEKTAIEETMMGINEWTNDAIDFVDELDRQSGGNGKTGKQIKESMNNPLVQKGFSLFGINIGMNKNMTNEMGERLKTKYNWYMFQRVCWMLGFIFVYVLFAAMIPVSNSTNNNRLTHSPNRRSRRPSSRNNYRVR